MYECPKCGRYIDIDKLTKPPLCPECDIYMIDPNDDTPNQNYEYNIIKDNAQHNNNENNLDKSSDLASKLESFSNIFWGISVISCIFICVMSIIQAVILADSGYGEFGVIVFITYILIAVLALVGVYFFILLLRGFAAIIRNTGDTNKLLNEINQKLDNK